MSGQIDAQFRARGTASLAAFLRGRHPHKTHYAVEAATGVPSATVRKWLEGDAAPGFFATLALIRAYGLEFLAAVMGASPAWLDDSVRASERAALRALHAELTARLERE